MGAAEAKAEAAAAKAKAEADSLKTRLKSQTARADENEEEAKRLADQVKVLKRSNDAFMKNMPKKDEKEEEAVEMSAEEMREHMMAKSARMRLSHMADKAKGAAD